MMRGVFQSIIRLAFLAVIGASAHADLRLIEWRLTPEHAWMVLPARAAETDLQAVIRYVAGMQKSYDLRDLINSGQLFSDMGQTRPLKRMLLTPQVLIMANSPKDMSANPERLNANASLYKNFGIQTAFLPVAAQMGLTSRETKELSELIIKKFEAAEPLGGGDVHPELYGEESDPSRRYFPSRDRYANELLRYLIYDGALNGRILIFAFCRGFQEVGVVMGHALQREVELDMQTPLHANSDHAVALVPGLFLSKTLGTQVTVVNSIHHQAVIFPSWMSHAQNGLIVSATAENGRVVEAAQSMNEMILGFQFHPEIMARLADPVGLTIFSALRKKVWWEFARRHVPTPCFALLQPTLQPS